MTVKSISLLDSFPILSNTEQIAITPLFFFFLWGWGGRGVLRKKNPHKCSINIRNAYEDNLCKLPELRYNQAQIQIFESISQNFTKLLEQTLNKPP